MSLSTKAAWLTSKYGFRKSDLQAPFHGSGHRSDNDVRFANQQFGNLILELIRHDKPCLDPQVVGDQSGQIDIQPEDVIFGDHTERRVALVNRDHYFALGLYAVNFSGVYLRVKPAMGLQVKL
jgi:hypothetical protein